MRRSLQSVWRRIEGRQGEQFATITGKPFTYSVTGNSLRTDRTDFTLAASDFEKALELVPIAAPGEITNVVRGSSYIWAILHDDRIRSGEW